MESEQVEAAAAIMAPHYAVRPAEAEDYFRRTVDIMGHSWIVSDNRVFRGFANATAAIAPQRKRFRSVFGESPIMT